MLLQHTKDSIAENILEVTSPWRRFFAALARAFLQLVEGSLPNAKHCTSKP
jgi:hypothetical protein